MRPRLSLLSFAYTRRLARHHPNVPEQGLKNGTPCLQAETQSCLPFSSGLLRFTPKGREIRQVTRSSSFSNSRRDRLKYYQIRRLREVVWLIVTGA